MKYLSILLIFLLTICLYGCSGEYNQSNGEYFIQDAAIEILSVVKAQAKYEDTMGFPSEFLEAYDECYENVKKNKQKNPIIMCVHIGLNVHSGMCLAARENSSDSSDLLELGASKFCGLMIDGADKLNQKIAYYNYEF